MEAIKKEAAGTTSGGLIWNETLPYARQGEVVN